MKGSKGLIFFLFILSILSGYLMSKVSLVGKAGMSLFYRRYNFLKIWWQGTLLILLALTALYFLHKFARGKCSLIQGKMFYKVSCFLAVTGLYFTYNDFRHTLSHRLLGERFHIGVYLFWIGWVAISLYFLTNPINEALQQLPVKPDTIDNKKVD